MKDTERRGYEMFGRVGDFRATRAAEFPPDSAGGQLFAALQTEKDIIEAQASAQSSGFSLEREGTATRLVARESLRSQLEAMSRTAVSLAQTTPGMENRFRMPHGNNDQNLINTARAFASDAAPHAARFVSFGLALNFIANLEATITEFEQAINRQHTGREMHVAGVDDGPSRRAGARHTHRAAVRRHHPQ